MNDRLAAYLEWMRAQNPALQAINSSLRLAVDCSNGMASLFARTVFPHATLLNDTPDGTFPAHSPNPLKADAREQLAACVRENGLDAGLIFDGDADRCMFVDERGDFVQPDYLIPIVARASARLAPPDVPRVVLHDVRTSRGAIETLREDGFRPVMVPVGHAFAKPVMRAEKALCGGELAGHYYFGEFFGCDSGLLAALRILAELVASGKPFAALMKPIVSRYENSGEINFKVADKDAAIARVLARAADFGPETGRSTMDGVRVEFADGWINVRKSNTEPYLRLLVERRKGVAEWVAALTDAIG